MTTSGVSFELMKACARRPGDALRDRASHGCPLLCCGNPFAGQIAVAGVVHQRLAGSNAGKNLHLVAMPVAQRHVAQLSHAICIEGVNAGQ